MRATNGMKYVRGAPRPLRPQEISLIDAMLRANQQTLPLAISLADVLVQDMNDGGMGSLRVVGSESRHFGSKPVEAVFNDEDGVLVSAAVILDQFGALYELDLWKVDSSALIRIPPISDVKISN
jgi:uncharacterized protein DUF6984